MNLKCGILIAFSSILICATDSQPLDGPPPGGLKAPGKIIIDTDGGGDDAGAILLALQAEKSIPGFEVIAITCTYGNTELKNVAQNVLKILTVAGRSNIPVYVGARRSLLRNYTNAEWYGKDGMGDFVFSEDIVGKIDESKHASIAMIDLAKDHAGQLSVLALGPLTNIAIAITLDPNFVNNIKQFYVMGGSVDGDGNVDNGNGLSVEANFKEDPESNFIVLNSTRGLPIVLFPWKTTLFAKIPVSWRTGTLGAIKSKSIEFLDKAERVDLERSAKEAPHFWNVADVILTTLMLWPELITKTTTTNLTPVFSGDAIGTVIVDSTVKPHNVKIVDEFNVEEFKNKLIASFTAMT